MIFMYFQREILLCFGSLTVRLPKLPQESTSIRDQFGSKTNRAFNAKVFPYLVHDKREIGIHHGGNYGHEVRTSSPYKNSSLVIT